MDVAATDEGCVLHSGGVLAVGESYADGCSTYSCMAAGKPHVQRRRVSGPRTPVCRQNAPFPPRWCLDTTASRDGDSNVLDMSGTLTITLAVGSCSWTLPPCGTPCAVTARTIAADLADPDVQGGICCKLDTVLRVSTRRRQMAWTIPSSEPMAGPFRWVAHVAWFQAMPCNPYQPACVAWCKTSIAWSGPQLLTPRARGFDPGFSLRLEAVRDAAASEVYRSFQKLEETVSAINQPCPDGNGGTMKAKKEDHLIVGVHITDRVNTRLTCRKSSPSTATTSRPDSA